MSVKVLTLFGDDDFDDQKPVDSEKAENNNVENKVDVFTKENTITVNSISEADSGITFEMPVQNSFHLDIEIGNTDEISNQKDVVPSDEHAEIDKAISKEEIFTDTISFESSDEASVEKLDAAILNTAEDKVDLPAKGATITFEEVLIPRTKDYTPNFKNEQDEAASVKPNSEYSNEDIKQEEDEIVKILPDWELKDKYHTIGEVAKMFEVNTSHIRFWTNEFNLQPRTTRKGDRLYLPKEIEKLKLIHYLVKVKKHTIKGAREKLKMNYSMVHEQVDLSASLKKLKEKLIHLQNKL